MKDLIKVILSRKAAKNLYHDNGDPSRRKTPLRVTCFLIAIVMALFFGMNQARAQTETELDMSAVSRFGEQITFTAKLKAPLQIQSAVILIYDMTQTVTRAEPVQFDEQGFSEFRFDTRQNLLRPFTTVIWRYELTLTDGSKTQSQSMSIVYDDNRFGWHFLQSDNFRVHWYNGDADFGPSALNAAEAGLQKIAEFFPTHMNSPIDIYIYDNESDLRGALYGTGEAWVAGHADSAASIITVTIEAGEGQGILMEQRIPHELMHIVLHRQVDAGYRNIPAWLREGMSMLAETYPNPDYDNVLKDAAARDVLIPMQNLCASFSPKLDLAFLAYAQSQSFTNYLRGQYGAEGLLALAQIYAGGVDCERGPERAFGVSLAKLETDWHASITGQSPLTATLEKLVPYLVLLCLVLVFPLIGVLGSMRKKGNTNGR